MFNRVFIHHLNTLVLALVADVLERNLKVLLAKVHVRGKSAVRLPSTRSTGSSLLEHLVDLLESKTLGLGNEKVCKED